VYRELPTAVPIAEAMELRIFLRDENPDIMDEFVSNNGKSRAIPVFVFYTADTRYITHFTERSESAHRGLAIAMDEAKVKLHLPPSATFGNLPDPERQLFLKELISAIETQSDDWRGDAVKEIRERSPCWRPCWRKFRSASAPPLPPSPIASLRPLRCVVHPLDSVLVLLMHRVHAQVTGPAMGLGPAPLADPPGAWIRVSGVLEVVVRPLQKLPRGRAADRVVGLVHGGQQLGVRARVALCEPAPAPAPG
jgi:hypothetical protein